MPALSLTSADDIRTRFSKAMSDMYRTEVPQYGTLMTLVAAVNSDTRSADRVLDQRLVDNGEVERLDLERHGAIRLGTPEELSTMRRLFAVMGMVPVGYYDLSVAGVPVHSTAFRPVEEESLRRNPFRVFTSLLRLDLIKDEALRAEAAAILAERQIFTPGCLSLIDTAEAKGGLTSEEAGQFVAEALETFRWHSEATVPVDVYQRLRAAHPLLADVVCFKGPHINHLTPRTLDIDAVQDRMPASGISPKAVIEGPPPRRVPILLRQTSFKALEEPVAFTADDDESLAQGTHTARFGEVEQRGIALTPKGRALYDRLLSEVRDAVQVKGDGSNAADYMLALSRAFEAFPDDEETLRREALAFFRYLPTGKPGVPRDRDTEALIAEGFLTGEPITYEDFLPVSAAGIFQSNLGDESQRNFAAQANRAAFIDDLGAAVADETALYAEMEARSRDSALASLDQKIRA